MYWKNLILGLSFSRTYSTFAHMGQKNISTLTTEKPDDVGISTQIDSTSKQDTF